MLASLDHGPEAASRWRAPRKLRWAAAWRRHAHPVGGGRTLRPHPVLSAGRRLHIVPNASTPEESESRKSENASQSWQQSS